MGKAYSLYKIKAPFKDKEISCPLPNKANAGRANRQGVSFLYLSSTMETALGRSETTSRALCFFRKFWKMIQD